MAAIRNILTVKIDETPDALDHIADRTLQEQSFELTDSNLMSGTGQGPFIKDFSFPFPIAMLAGSCFVHADMVGDRCAFRVRFAYDPQAAIHDIVGALASGYSNNDTYITVTPATMANIWKGYDVFLHDGTTQQSLGICTSKDEENNRIYVSAPADVAYDAADYVQSMFYPVPHHYLSGSPQVISIGENSGRSAYVPAYGRMEFIYWNTTETAKTVYPSFSLEYYI